MNEAQLYAIKLADGTWWSPTGHQPAVYYQRDMAERLRTTWAPIPSSPEGRALASARVVPVILTEAESQ